MTVLRISDKFVPVVESFHLLSGAERVDKVEDINIRRSLEFVNALLKCIAWSPVCLIAHRAVDPKLQGSCEHYRSSFDAGGGLVDRKASSKVVID